MIMKLVREMEMRIQLRCKDVQSKDRQVVFNRPCKRQSIFKAHIITFRIIHINRVDPDGNNDMYFVFLYDPDGIPSLSHITKFSIIVRPIHEL